MSIRLHSFLKGMVVATAMIGMFACGSDNSNNNNGGGPNPGTGTGNAATDTQTTSTEVQTTTQTGIQQSVTVAGGNIKFQATTDENVACAGGGTAHVTGTVTDGEPTTFELDFDFTNCTAINGSVTADGDFNASETSYSYNYTLNGVVGGNGCDVTFSDYAIEISIPDILDASTFSALIDGPITGECTNADTTCDYDQVNIGASGLVSGSVSCD